MHASHFVPADTSYAAAAGQCAVAAVLFVHLNITSETSVRRRQIRRNAERLPMNNEQVECAELHSALDVRGVQLLREFEDLNLPVLVLDNSKDGEAAIEETSRRIVRFINEKLWRRRLATT